MIENLPSLINDNVPLVRRGRFLTTTILVQVGETSYLIDINEGEIGKVVAGPHVLPRWAFALRASQETWDAFWAPFPKPGFHDLMALLKFERLSIDGDVKLYMTHLRYFKEILGSLRAKGEAK